MIHFPGIARIEFTLYKAVAETDKQMLNPCDIRDGANRTPAMVCNIDITLLKGY